MNLILVRSFLITLFVIISCSQKSNICVTGIQEEKGCIIGNRYGTAFFNDRWKSDDNHSTLNECIEGTVHTTNCPVNNGSGEQSKTCINGMWSNYGPCVLKLCNSDAALSSDKKSCSLVAHECTHGSIKTITCSAHNGKGEQSKKCNDGRWENYSSCMLKICNHNATLSTDGKSCTLPIDECIAGTMSKSSCSIKNGSGEQIRNCDNGKWGPYNNCKITSCKDNYYVSLLNNSCKQDCISGTIKKIECGINKKLCDNKSRCISGKWISSGRNIAQSPSTKNNTPKINNIKKNIP